MCSFFAAHAADPNAHLAALDSLEAIISRHPEDTASIHAYILTSEKLRGTNMDLAIEYGERSLEMARASGDLIVRGYSYNSLGNTLSKRGNYDKALEYYQEAIRIFKESDKKIHLAKVYLNIGSNYLNLGNNEQAANWLEKANELAVAIPDIPDSYLASLYHNLAMVSANRADYDESLQYYGKALDLAVKTGSLHDQALAHNNIGYTYQLQELHPQALEHYRQAYQIIRQTNHHLEAAYITTSLIDGLMHNQLYEEAYPLVDTLRRMTSQSNVPHLVGTVYRAMSEVYREQGKYKEALEQLYLYIAVHDSLLNQDQNAKIAALQNEVELSQKDAEITMKDREAQILDRENARQRGLMVALVAALVLALIALILLIVNSRARKAANLELKRSNALIQEQYEALRQSNDRLADLNREKDGLIGIVAHDLKSPLNKSAALTELIASVGPLNPSQEQALEMIRSVTAHGNHLIRDLLDLNSIEHPDGVLRYEEVDLGQLFLESAASFEAAARQKDLQIDWQAPSGDFLMHTDRHSLQRILENLVSNAVKFSPRGKKIWVIAHSDGNGSVEISVRDEGPGISAEDRKKLFKKFQRLSARPTGGESSTGLGLAITKTLVEKLHGSIRIESKPGMGAEFLVKLPRGKG
jgi:signal transduction histidine kinase